MAADLSSETPPTAIKRVTMDSSADDVTAITLPAWCRKVTVVFKQSGGTDDTGKLVLSGTDSAAAGNDHFPIGEIIYLAAGTASAYAHLLMEG